MPIFAENFSWIAFNCILALIPVIFVLVLRQKLSKLLYIFVFLLWLLFLPNTIYLITDLQYLPHQLLRSPMMEQLFLIIQFVTLAVLGVITYVYSLEPVSKVFSGWKVGQINKDLVYVSLNFLVAFGVVLGKVQRTHSWYVFTDPLRVIHDISATISSSNLLVWILFIGVVINVLFFLFRKYFSNLRTVKKSKKSRKS